MSINTKNIYNQPLSLENISQNVIPTDDGAYDIGSATKKWNDVYASTIHYNSLDPPIIGGGGGGSSQWTTSGTAIYYNAGSVGIGTTTPAYKLTTYGTSDTGMSIKNAQTSTEWGLAFGSGAFSSDALSGDTVLRSGSGRRLILQSGGGSSSILINSSGSVGIGSNNPIAKLDISKESRTGTHATHNPPLYITGTLGSASEGVEIRHTNGTQGIGFGFNSIYATGSNANQDINIMPKGSGKVGLGTLFPNAKLTIDDPNASNGLHISVGQNNNNAELLTVDQWNGGRRLTITPLELNFQGDIKAPSGTMLSQNIRVNNLGTISGAGQLQVNNNLNLNNNNISGVNSMTVSVLNYTSLNPPINSGGGSSQWTTSGTSIYYNSGSVGIGITNPTSKLHVIGDTKTTSISSTSVFPISINSSISLNSNDIIGVNEIFATGLTVGTLIYTSIIPSIPPAKLFLNRLTQISLTATNTSTLLTVLGVLNTDYVVHLNSSFSFDETNHRITYTGSQTKNFLVQTSFACVGSANITQISFELRKNNTAVSHGRFTLAANAGNDFQDFNYVSLANGDEIYWHYSTSNGLSTLSPASYNSSAFNSSSTPKPFQLWLTEI